MNLTTPIISQIEEMVADVPGWSPIDQLYTLFNLIYLSSHLSGDIVEIGSWCGRSSSVLGLAARLVSNTKVYCIDLFPEKSDWHQNEDGTYFFEVKIADKLYGAYQRQTVWKEPFEQVISPLYEKYGSIYSVFKKTIAENNLKDVVIAFKGDVALFEKSMNSSFKCKLIFIDGDHSYESVCEDIETMFPYLVSGGWICFDDAFSSYEGVDRAIHERIMNNPNFELCQLMTRKLFVARKK